MGILSAALTVPIRMLISSDWSMGVAILRDTMMTGTFPDLAGYEGEECLGRLVIFSLPRHDNLQQPVQTFRCSNVRVGALNAFTMRNLLWRVGCIPHNRQSPSLCGSNMPGIDYNGCISDSILEQMAYLVFNDEEDGFRLTWVKGSSLPIEEVDVRPVIMTESTKKGLVTPDIITTHEKTWEESYNDPSTGIKINTGDAKKHCQRGDLSIAFEAYLSVETLLGCIISARKKLVEEFIAKDEVERFPEYFYNLLSVSDDGRSVQLVVTFRHRRKRGSVGVFVTLDLFTQAYTTTSWMRNASVINSSSLRNMCNTLALNRRMRECKLGPYSCDADDTGAWEGLCKQIDCEFCFDIERDSNPILWKPFLKNVKKDRDNGKSRKETQQLIPKAISFSSLYPDCELITNRAVASVKPVSSMTGKMSPVEIVYGSSGIIGGN